MQTKAFFNVCFAEWTEIVADARVGPVSDTFPFEIRTVGQGVLALNLYSRRGFTLTPYTW